MIGNQIIIGPGTIKLHGNHPDTYTSLYCFVRHEMEGVRLDDNKWHIPNYLILESFYAPRHLRGANLIPELRGVIKLAAFQVGTLIVVDVAPGTVKKLATGNGRASKDEVRAAINKRYGMSVNTTDEADAIAVGLAGYWKITHPKE